jgi:hypothetical protein
MVQIGDITGLGRKFLFVCDSFLAFLHGTIDRDGVQPD